MPIIEDVTYNIDEDKFQKKIIVQFFKRKKSGSGLKRMYKSENSMIRPRKVPGTWTQPGTNSHLSSSVFRIGEYNNGQELALALPVENYK